MPSAYERKKVERAEKRALGMVRKELWAFPDAWAAIRAFAQSENEKVSHAAKTRDTATKKTRG